MMTMTVQHFAAQCFLILVFFLSSDYYYLKFTYEETDEELIWGQITWNRIIET